MFISREIDIKLCQNYTKTYVRYASASPDQNSLLWQWCILVMWYRERHVTIILPCLWLEFWWHVPDVQIILSIISIKNEKLVNSNNYRSKPDFQAPLCDIVIFRLIAYLLNMICLILQIYNILYVLVQFLYSFISISGDRNIR